LNNNEIIIKELWVITFCKFASSLKLLQKMEQLVDELRIYNDSQMTNRETPPGFRPRKSYVVKRGGQTVNIR
jgi:hypothetical protein